MFYSKNKGLFMLPFKEVQIKLKNLHE